MTGISGGSAWPFEYALMGTAPDGNGLLTPPLVLKKVPAVGPQTDATANSEQVFVTGIITATGNVEALRAVRASGARAQAAVSAIAQWEFQPAQLEGKPVASKILIGVTVVPEKEARGQN
jgi:hypothetical protein